MEILYNQLYQTTSFSTLSIKTYVTSLVDTVLANFPQGNVIIVKKDIDDFVLDAKRLQPLGIIINELLTNILKYAFSDKSTGIIAVSVKLVEEHIRISIHDNGKGIPVSVNFEHSTGFGFTLVKALSTQLDGTVRIERVEGTTIVLEFER